MAAITPSRRTSIGKPVGFDNHLPAQPTFPKPGEKRRSTSPSAFGYNDDTDLISRPASSTPTRGQGNPPTPLELEDLLHSDPKFGKDPPPAPVTHPDPPSAGLESNPTPDDRTPAVILAGTTLSSNASRATTVSRIWVKKWIDTISKVIAALPSRGHRVGSAKELSRQLHNHPVHSTDSAYDIIPQPGNQAFSIFQHVYRSGVQTEVKVVFGVKKTIGDKNIMLIGMLVTVEHRTAARLDAGFDLHSSGSVKQPEGSVKQPEVIVAGTREAKEPSTPIEHGSKKAVNAELAEPVTDAHFGGELESTNSWTFTAKQTNAISTKRDPKDQNIKIGVRLHAKEDEKVKKGVESKIPVLIVVDPMGAEDFVLSAKVEACQRLKKKLLKWDRMTPTGGHQGALLPVKTFGAPQGLERMSTEQLLAAAENC